MSLPVFCPQGCKLRVPARRAGTVIRCPRCRSIIRIPESLAEADSSDPSNAPEAKLLRASEPSKSDSNDLETSDSLGLGDSNERRDSRNDLPIPKRSKLKQAGLNETQDSASSSLSNQTSTSDAKPKTNRQRFSKSRKRSRNSQSSRPSPNTPVLSDSQIDALPILAEPAEKSEKPPSPGLEPRLEADGKPNLDGTGSNNPFLTFTPKSKESRPTNAPEASTSNPADAYSASSASARVPSPKFRPKPPRPGRWKPTPDPGQETETASSDSNKPAEAPAETPLSGSKSDTKQRQTPPIVPSAPGLANADSGTKHEPPRTANSPTVDTAIKLDRGHTQFGNQEARQEKSNEGQVGVGNSSRFQSTPPKSKSNPMTDRAIPIEAQPIEAQPAESTAINTEPGGSRPLDLASPAATEPAIDAGSFFDTAEADERDLPRVGITPDLTKTVIMRSLAIVLLLSGLFTTGPSIYEIVIWAQSGGVQPLERWVFVLIFMGAVQLLYATYIAQLPDWSSTWIASGVMLIMSCFDALLLASLFVGGSGSMVARAVQLAPGLRSQAMLWVLCMLCVHALICYVCGREAVRWKRSFDLFVEVLQRREIQV